MSKILDGKKCAEYYIDSISSELKDYVNKGYRKPNMLIVLVGDNPASDVYVRNKINSCQKSGFDHILKKYDDITEKELINLIEVANIDNNIDGIMIQLPLPKHIDQQKIINLISAEKDIDGFHPLNFGKMSIGLKSFRPATAYGICKLLQYYQIDIKGKHVVVIGRSNIVGKPISIMLANDFSIGNATVTLTHIETPNELLIKQTLDADIIVVAVGIKDFLTSDMVKDGVIIVDVGINKKDDGKLCGDVNHDVYQKTSFYTPVPGGVGPMTVCALMLNCFESYKERFSE